MRSHRWVRISLRLLILYSLSACGLSPVIQRTPTPTQEWVPPPDELVSPASFFDDFGDPVSGWEIGEYPIGSVGYSMGEYFVRCEQEDQIMWGQRQEWYGDVTIQVTGRQSIGPDNNNTGYGVLCRVNYDPDDDLIGGYAFRIAGDGYYAITSFIEGDSVHLVEWTFSEIVRQGNAENQLQVICAGDHLSFYVNGVFIAETWDDFFSSGDVGLIGVNYEAGVAEFLFDHFSLSSP